MVVANYMIYVCRESTHVALNNEHCPICETIKTESECIVEAAQVGLASLRAVTDIPADNLLAWNENKEVMMYALEILRLHQHFHISPQYAH